MSDFSRLIEDDEADPELARLFRAGREPAPLPRATYERSRKRVLGLTAAPAAFGVLAWVQYAALGASLGTAVAVVAALPRLLAEPPTPPDAPQSRSAASARIVAPPREPVRDTPSPAVTEPPASIGGESRAAPSATTSEHVLVRETKLLEKARAELERRPELCLGLLVEHAREFPNGALALEREFLAVASLVRLGRRSEAHERAATLRARVPGSLYEERLQRILGAATSP